MSKKNYMLLAVLLGFLGLALYTVSSHHGGHHESVTEFVKKQNDSVSVGMSSEDHLNNIDKVLAKVEGVDSFYIPARKEHLTSHPCSNCHTSSVEELKAVSGTKAKKAHWNIEIKHASAENMDCGTCHNTDADGNMDKLKTLTGKVVDFNESFKVCSQCHSTQYKDWLGGAHGKRLGGWTEPRVINTCVNCHNPHSPAFEKRWPSRINKTNTYPEEK